MMNSPVRKLNVADAPASAKGNRPTPLRVSSPVAVSAVDLHKSYRTASGPVPVLCGVNLAIREQEFVAITGSSGSGKSTLLHLLGTLDQPDQGEIRIGDRCVSSMRAIERDQLRNTEIGLIFQFYHLLPELTALENVMLPQMINCGLAGWFRNRARHRKRATELLEKVGLGHRLQHRPNQLSGGEMQRAAIARALMARPSLLLADEPTGNLDRRNSEEVMNALMSLRHHEQLTVVMVTHDDHLAARADRAIRLVEGRAD